MKALVLGATGFIGSHIARVLVGEGVDVRILRRSSSSTLALDGLKVDEFLGDLNDAESLRRACRGCEALFHAAGYYPLHSFGREKQKQIALAQVRNVLAAAEKSKISRIIYTSAMSTIGRAPSEALANEDTPYDPKDFPGAYYEIKYAVEREVLVAAERGLPVIVVNPTGVFGDYDVKPTSGTLVVEIARGRLPAIFDARLNVIDARDVARAQLAALHVGQIGRRYLLGGHNTTVREVTDLVARLAGIRPPRFTLPLALGEIASYTSELTARIFHQDKPLLPHVGIEFLKYGMHYDTRRAREELGLRPVSMEKTFERAIGWFREKGYC